MKKIGIIGSGFSSLSAACYLKQAGFDVSVFEKNTTFGGRARQLKKDGFTFDMGPTWYWMPDVFERFFSDFNKKPSDFYHLEKLSPGYKVFFGKDDSITISDRLEKILEAFEQEEKGSAKKLKQFLKLAEKNYNIAIKDLVYNPGISPLELVSVKTALEVKQFIISIHTHVNSNFKSPKLRQILEFPVLFLGAKPENTPLFYAFMNYADFILGTWYPKGGMYSVVNGMIDLAKNLGVDFKSDSNVEQINTANGVVKSLIINGEEHLFDIVVSGADYHHTESLLAIENRNYKETYWNKKVMAPSALLFYVGFDSKIKNVLHHTLFFDESFDKHSVDIYDDPKWPEKPLFYASFPSITEKELAPEGKEAAVFLIPLAPDLEDNDVIRNEYFEKIMKRLQDLTGQDLTDQVIFKESYCIKDFKEDYNSFKGNAYGLANTLMQTAFLRPKLKSKKVKNMYYTGQLTVPGPGVPPALISGQLVADLILKNH
jgi:phytoene desaturase